MNFGDERLPLRFWSKVHNCPVTGCWLWRGFLNEDGYGILQIGSRTDGTRRKISAHRLSYGTLVGEIPVGLEIDHLCTVRNCANPGHLEPVTHVVNMLRSGIADARGRFHRSKTHCKFGHEFAGDNLYVAKGGSRHCKACSRARDKVRDKVRRPPGWRRARESRSATG